MLKTQIKLNSKDISQIKSRVIAANKKAGKVAAMYVYCTEMTGLYYPRVGVVGKSVLTIAGSGDQMIEAYFFGAKQVVGFDLNKMSGYIVKLKFGALKNLRFKEYIRYFGTEAGRGYFSYSIYKKFSNILDARTKSFFDALYKYYKFDGKKIIRSEFFNQRDSVRLISEGGVGYLKNESNYNKAQGIVAGIKPEVVTCDLESLVDKVSQKFDVINLSNSPNFVIAGRYSWRDDAILPFYKTYILPLRKILNKKGRVFLYLYSIKDYTYKPGKKIPPLAVKANREVLSQQKEFSVREFGFRGIGSSITKVSKIDKVVCFDKR